MEITLFGIKIRVELAIACMILGAVICYMLFCSCSLKEGVTLRKSQDSNPKREGGSSLGEKNEAANNMIYHRLEQEKNNGDWEM